MVRMRFCIPSCVRVGWWTVVGSWLMWALPAGGTVETAREAQAVAQDLARQNVQLRQQVAGLTQQLAAAREELDRQRVRPPAGDPGLAPAVSAMEDLQVLEVNPALRMVVLAAGMDRGVQAGQRFEVLRAAKRVAVVRAVDVRQLITGAVVEEGHTRFPEKGDRVTPLRGSSR